MPWWFVPVFAGGGGGTATAGSGISLGTIFFFGSAVVAGIAIGSVIDISDDWLDTPTDEDEAGDVISKAGEQSKADARAVRNCANCVWCQVTIHAQGVLVGGDAKSTMTLGPYFVQGRTVTTREGIILLSGTHAMLQEELGRRAFREIEKMGIFARTAAFINSRPPHGLPNGEHRSEASRGASTNFRYDINVIGTVNAFMS